MKDKAIVDEIHVKDNDLAMPTLLKFQNGTLLTNRKEHTLFTKLKDKHNNKTALVLADEQIYEGVIKDNDELTDLYICVRNKTTNKCRILPIEQVQLHNHIFKQLDQEERQQISRDDKYKTLLSQFGGRKAVRYMNSQQQMKMDIDLMKENLDQTVQDNKTALDESTTDGGVLDDQKYLDSIRVKFNPDAKHLHEVYNVKDAIPEELLDRLEEEANMVMSCNVEDVPIQSIYLREELKLALNAEKPVDEIKLKIKMIIYMDALKNLLRSRERYMKKIKMSDVTEKVENDIRSRFVDSTVKRCMRSGFTTEKALCHFIVLALMLSDKFEVPMQTLQEELTTVRAKIVRYGHVVCALPKENGTMLTLRLPKNVKPLSTSFGRKKRKTI